MGIIVIITICHIPNDHIFCVFAAHWGPSGYSVFKFLLYCILVLRSIAIYKNSVISYNPKKLKLWILILFIWTVANLVVINLTTGNKPGTCETVALPVPIMASMALIGT